MRILELCIVLEFLHRTSVLNAIDPVRYRLVLRVLDRRCLLRRMRRTFGNSPFPCSYLSLPIIRSILLLVLRLVSVL